MSPIQTSSPFLPLPMGSVMRSFSTVPGEGVRHHQRRRGEEDLMTSPSARQERRRRLDRRHLALGAGDPGLHEIRDGPETFQSSTATLRRNPMWTKVPSVSAGVQLGEID